MRLLIAFSKIKQQSGFTLLELIVVGIILAIAGALAGPSLIGSRREGETKKAFTKIKAALVEAQSNADRKSTTCTVQFTASTGVYNVSGTPSGCVIEPFTIDTNVVSVTKDNFTDSPTDIAFTFRGTKDDNTETLLWITRKDFSNNPIQNVGKCIVISPIGMIRTGINNSGSCDNPENKRYDNS